MSKHEEKMGLLPIMSPLYNLREICKQVALLEEHLNQPRKRCPDCIRKHFLTIEALFEEAISLDKENKYGEHLDGKAQDMRDLQGAWLDSKDTDQAHEVYLMIAQALRQIRKGFAPICFDVRKMANLSRIARSYVCPHMKIATDYSDYEEWGDRHLDKFNRGRDTLYVDIDFQIADHFGPLEGAELPPEEPEGVAGLYLLPKGDVAVPRDPRIDALPAEFLYKQEYIPMIEAVIKGLKKEIKEFEAEWPDLPRWRVVETLEEKIEEYEDQLKVLKRARTATKTQAEKEDDAAQKLIRKAPKKKPPRKDLRKNRVEMTDDPDLQGVGRGDEGDPDLSRRSQKMARMVRNVVRNYRRFQG